jgi:hypothetical protein
VESYATVSFAYGILRSAVVQFSGASERQLPRAFRNSLELGCAAEHRDARRQQVNPVSPSQTKEWTNRGESLRVTRITDTDGLVGGVGWAAVLIEIPGYGKADRI